MKEKINVLVLFGGVSSEHDISCISAASVIENIDREKYAVHAVGITSDGKWFLTEAPAEIIKEGKWEDHPGNLKAAVSPDRSDHGLLITEEDGKVHARYIDVVFPVLHGKNGEDGTMQGLLEIAGLPYAGPGTCASACAMDKSVTKLIVDTTGVAQAGYYLTDRFSFSEDPLGETERAEERFSGKYPLFVKPCSAGSSVGVSKVYDKEQLFEAIKIALDEDHKALIEEAITGREIEVAVLGNRNVRTSVVGEIVAADDFYSFEAKYENAASETRILDDVPEEKIEEIRTAAAKVYQAVGCRGMSRADFFLEEGGRIVFNEINTIPGFTSISMYPQLWEACGLGYSQLLDQLLMLAMDEIE